MPFEGGSLPGYFVHAQNAKRTRTPVRRVLRRARRHQGDPVRARRAGSHQARHLGAWCMDGPGTGEAIRFRGHYPAPRLRGRGQRVHRLPREAQPTSTRRRSASSRSASAATTRRAAPRWSRASRRCIAWGAIWDYHATWKQRIDAGFSSLAVGARAPHHVDPGRDIGRTRR